MTFRKKGNPLYWMWAETYHIFDDRVPSQVSLCKFFWRTFLCWCGLLPLAIVTSPLWGLIFACAWGFERSGLDRKLSNWEPKPGGWIDNTNQMASAGFWAVKNFVCPIVSFKDPEKPVTLKQKA